MCGLTVEVLLEGAGRRPGQLVGKSPWLQAVHVDAPAIRVGNVVRVAIDHIGANTLSGTLSDAETRTRAIA
jgi:tRNA-2-methylthio-N6-dimethylallyladenosine synthase